MTISIVLEARQIPNESDVCKATGSKVYTLRREIRIFKEKKLKDEDIPNITASDGIVFLVSDDGNINCVSETTKLKMNFDDLYDAKYFIEELIYESECK